MNQPPDLPFGPDTDEALNALLDGELDAFATEHGMTEESARERLEAWPDFATRRAALEQVRVAVGAATPPLDDLTRRRLVRTAANALPGSSATTPPPTRSWARIVAVAAAALIVVAGIGFAISSNGGDDSSMSSSTGDSASVAGEPLRGNVGDLGDVTSPEALRALLDRREAAADNSAKSPGGTIAAPQSGGSSADAADGGESYDQRSSVKPDECARQLAGSRTVAFTGTGAYQGAPVTVIGITEGARTIVFVVPSTDCTKVLTSISR